MTEEEEEEEEQPSSRGAFSLQLPAFPVSPLRYGDVA